MQTSLPELNGTPGCQWTMDMHVALNIIYMYTKNRKLFNINTHCKKDLTIWMEGNCVKEYSWWLAIVILAKLKIQLEDTS